MRILLDTVTLVWWLRHDKRLGGQSKLLLVEPRHDCFVSSFSVFEWRLKARIKKLKHYPDLEEKITANGFQLLEYDAGDSKYIPEFTGLSWNDPFDFGLVSQSLARNFTFMTSDRRILAEFSHRLRLIDAGNDGP